ncbi:MAG: hypothetical protein ACE5PV_17240 [Candidatus Poribacteria bacterium]
MIFITAFMSPSISVFPTMGVEYYVSNSGDDGNLGTSPSEARRTISKVNDFEFSPATTLRWRLRNV